jgi:hypothetical protein
LNSPDYDDGVPRGLRSLDRATARKKRKNDPNRINVRQDSELQYWAKYFGVEQSLLTRAVKAVGPNVEQVRAYLFAKRQAEPPQAGQETGHASV